MNDERQRETRKFRSKHSEEKWGVWCAITFLIILPIALVCKAFGWV